METTVELRPGQEILAGDEAIGELVDTIIYGDVKYLHVRRYGGGHDELYIPSIAVERVVPRHIYLNLAAEELLSQPWHERPGQSLGHRRSA
jgi:hypothetical protein